MEVTGAIEALVRRDRLMVATGLAAITGLACVYLVYLAAGMGGMQAMAMPALRSWGVGTAVAMFVMWVVMMVAMMTPSAAPMILLHAAILRKSGSQASPAAATSAFATGYLAVWTGFSAFATALQWGFEQAAMLSPMMVSTSPYLGSTLLIAAGLYQMTSLKQVCLQYCRSPVHFLSSHWRKGTSGAFRMGLDHGVFCVGCCWVLMGLLFVSGVMNMLWIATLAAFVLLEKMVPHGRQFSRATGGVLMFAGLWLIVQG